MILLPQKVAYRGTISSLRISSVDGTAFLDNCAALVPYADGNHLIEIYDASGNQLKGYLSAAGDGEGLGDEINSGTLTILTLYKITATEENHFGTGLEVGEYFTSAGSETCDANNKVKAVTEGSTDGCVIVSTKGGAVPNFAYKNTSFTYNAETNYVVVRKAR